MPMEHDDTVIRYCERQSSKLRVAKYGRVVGVGTIEGQLRWETGRASG